MKEFTIKRSEWIRGETGRSSLLLRPEDNKMCCLGFYLRAVGMPSKVLSEMGMPISIVIVRRVDLPEAAQWLLTERPFGACNSDVCNSDACQRLMTANDKRELEDGEREKLIAAEFAKHDVTVTFID